MIFDCDFRIYHLFHSIMWLCSKFHQSSKVTCKYNILRAKGRLHNLIYLTTVHIYINNKLKKQHLKGTIAFVLLYRLSNNKTHYNSLQTFHYEQTKPNQKEVSQLNHEIFCFICSYLYLCYQSYLLFNIVKVAK